MITHLSLFSGVGGLDLAAELAGCVTVGQCEWAEYPTKVLEKHWPDVPRWRDIRTLTKESFYERTGRRTVDIISGGFPCQPFSVAGKQRGKEDDRYLWPEMVRVIKELRPTWIIGENVAGIVRMALPDILSELEACGYRTRAFLVPACAVGARHRRYRVAIVGYAEHDGLPAAEIAGSIAETSGRKPEREETSGEPAGAGGSADCAAVGRAAGMENTDSIGCVSPENVYEQPGRTKPERAGEIVANAESEHKGRLSIRAKEEKPRPVSGGKDVQYSNSAGCEEQYASGEPDQSGFFSGGRNERNVRHTSGERLSDRAGQQVGGYRTPEQEPERSSSNVSNTNNRFCQRTEKEIQTGRDTSNSGSSGKWERPVKSLLGGMAYGSSYRVDGDIDYWFSHYWDEEPDIPRVASGIKHRVERLKALGNMVVPQWAYPIFRAIVEISG